MENKYSLRQRTSSSVADSEDGPSTSTSNTAANDPSNPECETCFKRFSRRDTLHAHIRSAHEKSSIRCGVCKKQFPTRSKLERHELTHTDEGEYQCSICSKVFQRADHLKSHEATHADLALQCSECSETFRTKLAYDRHMRSRTDEDYAHGKDEETCKVCSHAVGASTHLLFVDSACGFKMHQCTHCFERFPRCAKKKWLGKNPVTCFIDHFQEKHVGPKIHRKIGFNCSRCSKLFSSKQQARRHEEEQCWANPVVVEKKKK